MDKGTVVRGLLLVLAYVNALLAAHNYKTIQLDEKTLSVIVALGFSAYGYIKHNFIGKKGAAQKQVLEQNNLK